MKTRILILMLICLSFVSCDRVYEEDIISVTSPELHVMVVDENQESINSAIVMVYQNEEDYNNQIDPIVTKESDDSGKAEFTSEELIQPGTFFIVAEKNSLIGRAQTPYLLLNDGHTSFEILIN